MSAQNRQKIRPKTARKLIFLFIVFGIILGIFDTPNYSQKLFNIAHLSSLGEKIYSWQPYRFGLDIQGGTHLVYQADINNIAPSDQSDSMNSLRDVIERRVNLYGVAEPNVQVERAGSDWRLIVDLAGVKDINAAIHLIGITPYLEFKTQLPIDQTKKIISENLGKDAEKISSDSLCISTQLLTLFIQTYHTDPCFQSSKLNGSYLQKATLHFDQTTYQPSVNLVLTGNGSQIFDSLTKDNVGKRIAIYIDGTPESIPVVNQEISGGQAQITGNFTPDSAKELATRLNAGALPVPIKLIEQQSVGATLGQSSLAKSLFAGLLGFLAVALFMIAWYRLPGVLAVLALLFYVSIVLMIFKIIPVTLTIAGIAGFILSIGMAVDANILIFERMKEELRAGRVMEDAIREGFDRAWTSIRDSNISSLITAVILYWLGSSVVQGFALTLGIGIIISMFSAISVTRTLLLAFMSPSVAKMKILFLSGFSKT